eukprot:SAG31_NODE_16770_length_697_cov_0.827759_1_plen_64_part_10
MTTDTWNVGLTSVQVQAHRDAIARSQFLRCHRNRLAAGAAHQNRLHYRQPSATTSECSKDVKMR